jgi:hypothetical protein
MGRWRLAALQVLASLVVQDSFWRVKKWHDPIWVDTTCDEPVELLIEKIDSK